MPRAPGDDTAASGVARAVVPLVAVALAVAILGPLLLARGFALVYDMVFTPAQPLLPSSVGLGPALPRAVPADALVALASVVVPGDVLQKLVLAGSVVAGALGVARLVPTDRVSIRVVAAIAYTWNAWLAERLFLGHWPVLVAWAVLPWVVLAGLRVRRGDRRGWPWLVVAMAPAMLGPTGGLLAAGAAVAAVGRRGAALAAALGLALNAPWWVPSVLRAGAAVSDPDGVAAFAARGESWGGPVVAVLGLGGVWNADVVPASRESIAAPVVSLLVAGLALWGCAVLARRWGPRPARAVVALGVLGVLIGVAGAVPPLDAALRWAIGSVPGAGLIRDGQRWTVWWALPLALGFALAAEEITRRLRDPLGRAAVVAGAALLPILTLPDLAWGGLGRLEPVRYPDDWATVAAIVEGSGDTVAARGDVLVLPFGAYRAFGWNDGRIALDPAPRLLAATVVTDDTLPVGPGAGEGADGGDLVVDGEDPRAARVRRALAAGEPVTSASIGVRWVVVEHDTPGTLPSLDGTTLVHAGEHVSLRRVDAPVPAPDPTSDTPDPAIGAPTGPDAAAAPERGPPAVPVLVADAIAVALVGGASLWLALPVGRLARRRQR